jgi:hypothetical protein
MKSRHQDDVKQTKKVIDFQLMTWYDYKVAFERLRNCSLKTKQIKTCKQTKDINFLVKLSQRNKMS